MASLNILHRDLACRNILIGPSKVLKVANFGLAQEAEEVCVVQRSDKQPIRWMAPEAVTKNTYSKKSDV